MVLGAGSAKRRQVARDTNSEPNGVAEFVGGKRPQKFDGESTGERSHDLSACHPDSYRRADWYIGRYRQGGARDRNVDYPRDEFAPVRQDQGGVRHARGDALVPAVFFYWETAYYGVGDNVQGFKPGAYIGDTWNAWEWNVK